MLTPRIGYSLEPPASEVEFLRRELAITWRQVSQPELQSLLQQNPRLLLLVSEPLPYLPVLRAASQRSLVVLMLSDEAYAPERLDVARSPALVCTYRHYPAQPASALSILRSAAGYVRDSKGTSQSATTVIPNVASGLRLRARMAPWQQLRDQVRTLPLGYTDTFARAFVDSRKMEPDQSLFDAALGNKHRSISLSFRGNRGLAQRIVGLEKAQRVRDNEVVMVDADWSARAEGDTGRSYVESLTSARFVLTPPGFANNESFRFYEALACGALPVEVTAATTHLGTVPWRDGGSIQAYSWAQALAEAERMPESVRQARVSSARTLVAGALRSIAQQIHDDVEG